MKWTWRNGEKSRESNLALNVQMLLAETISLDKQFQNYQLYAKLYFRTLRFKITQSSGLYNLKLYDLQ